MAPTPEDAKDKKDREDKEKKQNLDANNNYFSRRNNWVAGLKKEVGEEMDITLTGDDDDYELPKTLENIFEDDMLATLSKLSQRNQIKPAWLGGYVKKLYQIEYNYLKEMMEGGNLSASRIERTLKRADMREFLWVKSAYATVINVAKSTRKEGGSSKIVRKWYASWDKNETMKYMLDNADLEDRKKMSNITKKIKDRYERTQVGGERERAKKEKGDMDFDTKFGNIPRDFFSLEESKNNRLKKLIKIITSEKLQTIKEEKQIGYKKK
jgi:hypothetical protein